MFIGPKYGVSESIVQQICKDIKNGVLREGDKLPSCRELAMQYGINPNTVQKAFATLEERGIIETVPKKGAYVMRSPLPVQTVTPDELLILQIRAAQTRGVTKEQLLKAVDYVYKEGE